MLSLSQPTERQVMRPCQGWDLEGHLESQNPSLLAAQIGNQGTNVGNWKGPCPLGSYEPAVNRSFSQSPHPNPRLINENEVKQWRDQAEKFRKGEGLCLNPPPAPHPPLPGPGSPPLLLLLYFFFSFKCTILSLSKKIFFGHITGHVGS